MNVEQMLRDTRVEWPATPDIASALRLPAPAPRRRSRRTVVAVAFAVLALAGTAGAAALGLFGGTVEVERGPVPKGLATEYELGPRVSLEEAERRLGFRPPYPRALRDLTFHATRTRFAATDGDVLFTAFRGDIPRELIRKVVEPGTEILQVRRTLWIEGGHLFFYRDPDGEIRDERLSESAYLFERGGLILRLEGGFTRREAIRLAASVR